MHFRNAIIEDLPIIVDIYNSTIAGRMVTADTAPVEIKEKEAWFYLHTPARRPLWMVENERGQVLGWVSYQDFYGRPAYNGTAEISIYLHVNARGQGLGKKILQHSINQCSGLGIHTLLGFIFAHNEPSIQLFKKLGFEEWANLRDIASMDGKPYSLNIFGKKI